MKIVAPCIVLLLACARDVVAQGDVAGMDGLDEAVRATASALRDRTEIAALKLTATQLDAYVAATLEIDETLLLAQGAGSAVRLPLRQDHDAAVRRVTKLAKDEDASRAVVSSWTRMQQLQRERSANPSDQKGQIAALNATYLAARASAALARTEPSTVGGHAPSAEGRRRADRRRG